MAQKVRRAFNNVQPQAQATGAVPLGVANLVKLLENLGLVLWRNANAAVPHLNPRPNTRACVMARCAARQQHRALLCVAHRVGDQVEQDALQQNRVAAHPGGRGANPQAQALLGCGIHHGQAYLLKNGVQGRGVQIHLHRTGVKF